MGLDNYPVLERSIDASSSGDNIIIPGVVGQTISVFRLFIIFGADTDVTFKDGHVTVFDGPLPMTANGSIVLDFTELHWFKTSPGNDFIINLSVGTQMSGRVYYTQLTPP